MTMFLCWVVFPVVLGLVGLGCGLLVESVAGFRLPGAVLPVVGIATALVAGEFATMSGATAQLATPLVVALAVAGYGLSYPWRGRRIDGWALACAVGVFAVYAAPIVLSGSATFAGYITLDDTATWLALTDHVMNHGRAVSGLAPSTYQQVLADYLNGGVPVGAEMILGFGGKLTRQDVAWLFEPDMALFASVLALAIYSACDRLVSSGPLRALAAFLGAQSALLFAYYLWSGIKELTAAAMLALVCVLVVSTVGHWRSIRGVVPVSIAISALLAVLSPAGGVWLIVPALIVGVAIARRSLGQSLGIATRVVGVAAAFSIPSIAIGYTFLKGATGDELTSATESANLGHPLHTLQLFGIWPATDFRTQPHNAPLTYILIIVLVAAIGAGLWLAWRRRAWAIPLYLVTAVGGFCLAVLLQHVGLGSPWLNAKAMAEASPALVAAGVAGAAAVFETGRRTEAIVACAAIAVGVLWSNGLAYSNAWLAPRSQLAELQTIGTHFAGDGPTLMTEYQPYGVRHFLRRMDPEGASERRRRLIPLLNGQPLTPGLSADLDQFQTKAILVYRTIVLRRSPVESRPPSVYSLVWQGHWYDVWQRPIGRGAIVEHLGLGDALDPGAVPSCATVRSAASRAAATGGELATVLRPRPPIVSDLTNASFPSTWGADSSNGTLVPHGGGEVSLSVSVPDRGRYALWLGGSFRRTMSAKVDGHRVGSVTDQLNNEGQWTQLGTAALTPGTHQVVLDYGGSRLAPGSGGLPFGFGPLVLSQTSEDAPVRYVAPGNASSLCHKRLDWLEVVRG